MSTPSDKPHMQLFKHLSDALHVFLQREPLPRGHVLFTLNALTAKLIADANRTSGQDAYLIGVCRESIESLVDALRRGRAAHEKDAPHD